MDFKLESSHFLKLNIKYHQGKNDGESTLTSPQTVQTLIILGVLVLILELAAFSSSHREGEPQLSEAFANSRSDIRFMT